jgi:hypothetical protein
MSRPRKSRPAPARRARTSLLGPHVVTLRDGGLLVGKILDPTVIVDVHGQPIRVPMANVVWIHFRNPYGVPQDEVRLGSGSALLGTVKNPSFRIELEETGQTIRIETKTILTIQNLDISRRP